MWGKSKGPTKHFRTGDRCRGLAIVTLLGAAAIFSCGKERPFARGTSALQPEVETRSDAAAEVPTPTLNTACSDAGCPAPLKCDPSSDVCVECQTSSDCAAPDPHCDMATHSCVPCLVNDDCPGATPVCRTAAGTNRCVECSVDAECPEARPVCDPNTNECTSRCTSSTQCPAATPVCNVATEICVGCLSDTDCSGAENVCDVATARCVQCLDDSGCEAGQVCSAEARACVQCADKSQCLDALNAHCQLDPMAQAAYTCVGCVDDRDCAGKLGLGARCRASDARCVECVSDEQCTDNPAASNCSSDGACIVCGSDGDCSLFADRTSCLPDVGCVECVDASDCAGNSAGGVCKTTNVGQAAGSALPNTCVECASNTDCASPEASLCVNNQCVACATNDDCAHVDSTPGVPQGLSLGVCDAGVCVECTGPQGSACGANVCDSLTKECAIGRPARNADLCEPCVSDLECAVDARCVQLAPFGPFCMPLRPVETCSNTGPTRGFRNPITAATLDEPSANICVPLRATCPAFAAYRAARPCADASDDAACGQGGLCEQVSFTDQFSCTIPCASGFDCVNESCIDDVCSL